MFVVLIVCGVLYYHFHRLSVEKFGAVCDGMTDDSVALQRAFNEAAASGRIVKLPRRTCVFDDQLVLVSDNDGLTSRQRYHRWLWQKLTGSFDGYSR